MNAATVHTDSFVITPETKVCISLAGKPGQFGTRFHNYLYRRLGLNFIYKSFGIEDLEGAVAGIRALGIRGAAVTMPFKEKAVELVDDLDPDARLIGAINTIVNESGMLFGTNTDWYAVRAVLERAEFKPECRVALAGSGGMAKAAAFALSSLGAKDVRIVARNEATGAKLASRYDWTYSPRLGPADEGFDVLINATPQGTKDAQTLPFDRRTTESSRLVVDAVVSDTRSEWVGIAQAAGVHAISGFEITVEQGRRQFELYTGLTLKDGLVTEAARYAKA